MATNEQEAPPAPTQQERVLAAVGMTAAKVTDTGPHTGLSIRVWALIVALAAILAVSTFPLNVIGEVIMMALALTLASRSRVAR